MHQGGTHGVLLEIEHDILSSNPVQTLDEAVCISHRASTLGKGINPTILPPAMGK